MKNEIKNRSNPWRAKLKEFEEFFKKHYKPNQSMKRDSSIRKHKYSKFVQWREGKKQAEKAE